ncbi:MAG: hypothetical protein IH626_18180 [Rhodospirillales bacterium]|nr:hypothetical protein [Rhodospirillales bacterium]
MKNAVLPVLVTLMGVAWQFGMTILTWMGPLFDTVGLGDAVIDLQVWLLNHPEAAADIGAWSLMAGGVVMLVAFFVVPPFYRSWRQKDLEIVYDPADADGRFGGVGPWLPYEADDETPPVTAFILRVGVRNNGSRPMLDVCGTIEGAIVKRPHPVPLRFTQTHERTADLGSERMAFIDIAALPANPDEWTDNVSRIVVRIKAQQTEEVAKTFFIDKKRMPPMYPADERNARHVAQAAPAASPAKAAPPELAAPSEEAAPPAGPVPMPPRRGARRKRSR